jgi:uncharacterized membrane protein YcaP (DUF421 family)
MVALGALLVYFAVLLYTRIAGLRSFAKMSGTDFAGTVAIGSAMATVVLSRSVPLAQGLVGIGMFFLIPVGLAFLRRRGTGIDRIVENQPLLLMRDGELIEHNLGRGRVSIEDLRAKLREANVIQLSQLKAVVLETTGDVSVLHGSDDTDVEPWLLERVEGA